MLFRSKSNLQPFAKGAGLLSLSRRFFIFPGKALLKTSSHQEKEGKSIRKKEITPFFSTFLLYRFLFGKRMDDRAFSFTFPTFPFFFPELPLPFQKRKRRKKPGVFYAGLFKRKFIEKDIRDLLLFLNFQHGSAKTEK